MIENENCHLIIGYLDNIPVASDYIRIEKAKPQHHPDYYGYLGFMYVDQAHRGKGFNGQILNYLKKWAKDKGISKLKLDVYAENENAVNVYKNLALKAT